MTHTILPAPDPRQPEIVVTKTDYSDLEHLLATNAKRWNWRSVEYLVRELMRATIVDESMICPDIVTMGSRVEYREHGRNSSEVVTLSYPGQRGLCDDAISVLTPIGAALLGLAAGQSICYSGPDGCPITITVLRVIPQPDVPRQRRVRSKMKARSTRRAAVLQDR